MAEICGYRLKRLVELEQRMRMGLQRSEVHAALGEYPQATGAAQGTIQHALITLEVLLGEFSDDRQDENEHADAVGATAAR